MEEARRTFFPGPVKRTNGGRKRAQLRRISQLWGCTHGLGRDRRRGITTVAPMAELVDAPHSKRDLSTNPQKITVK